MNEIDKPCCDYFLKFRFNWFKMVEGSEEIYLMPHIIDGADRVRVNNCPSCGAYVRDIKLKSIV